ncbi:MAG: 50S ribosome-binding GTPase, partial [Clostridia bacterium]|nr:50S ribosome-binding GTPase [Clostridia bacterium]
MNTYANAKFITSAASKAQFITADKPIIAVCGKSNVGKSSFINMLANQKKLAKVSQEPGRTRLI